MTNEKQMEDPPNESKTIAKNGRVVVIAACVIVAILIGVVTTLAVMLQNCNSSKTATNLEQEIKSPVTDGPTFAPTNDRPEPTTSPTPLHSALPTLSPSATPSARPGNPICQIEYPDTPIFSCLSREESYGEDAIAYTFVVDCDTYGDYEAKTGLWESSRTKSVILNEDWVVVQNLFDEPAGQYSTRNGNCWISFAISTEDTPTCLRIRFQDDVCTVFYRSDCIDLTTCSWD